MAEVHKTEATSKYCNPLMSHRHNFTNSLKTVHSCGDTVNHGGQ